MAYDYKTERPWLFTEEGSECFVKARDAARELLQTAGAFVAFRPLKGVPYGDTWKALAILDRMVETGDIREVTFEVAGQDRVFVARGLR